MDKSEIKKLIDEAIKNPELEKLLSSVARPTINADLQKMQKIGLIKAIGTAKQRYYEPSFYTYRQK
ncbi:hypothetical protein COT42_01030 [Candidatus Saganbacteria bacterium CG08_land_8_20_14_0_20_45_16]|uniref:HTH deoR-type domain-containing protein n=1 Tax=Candidatus Saganbacteria bacterium CG08_land_8_20_14_0_20_45_16 TaxID=2014293 RepID=A0A2H0Y254_UNCSA|nr:MAG: hypothetical protein COT42_01030 [Candidatus Saganbacteria bacterium CG08_land_8_20_14_0_20_45_16]